MRRTLRAAAVVLTVAVVSVGCGTGSAPDAPGAGGAAEEPATTPGSDQPSQEGEFMRGTLTPGTETTFSPCGRDVALAMRPLDAYVAGLLEEVGATGTSMYVEILGRPGGRVPGVTVTRLLHAATESPGCDAPEPDYRLRGHGNEPFWSVEVHAETAVWRTPEEIDGVTFTIEEIQQVGAGWLLRASTPAGRTVEASFAATSCRDSMADAWFGYTVQVRLDEREMHGCGRQGQSSR